MQRKAAQERVNEWPAATRAKLEANAFHTLGQVQDGQVAQTWSNGHSSTVDKQFEDLCMQHGLINCLGL